MLFGFKVFFFLSSFFSSEGIVFQLKVLNFFKTIKNEFFK